jgi:eukaryotic-like serine/threonine-protein kinase
MDRFKRLIIEAHRRSLWQVLGVYLVSSWVVIQVVNEFTRAAGLPDWVPPFALVLLMVGLPVVMATAVVQEGGPGAAPEAPPEMAPDDPLPPPSPERSLLQRVLTWKRAILGGVAAFALLAVLVGAYFVSWATGIGPVGSLVAQGAIQEGERVVLADLRTSSADPTLGAVVTDALRIDLNESPVLRVLEPLEVQQVLQRMQLDGETPLTADLAREVALRDGVKAVLEGEVSQAGSGFVLSATLREAESGRSLAAFRETARNEDEVIPAIDRLSRRIRERAGESLRSIHAGPGLERVTTSSLDALRTFSEANRAFERADFRRSIALLEEALELDPEFAMAWRRLAVVLNNTNLDPARRDEAATRAWELRGRLSEKERHLAAAFYHSTVTQDLVATADAYRRVLDIDPDDPPSLNNLGNVYGSMGELEAAEELYERAASGPGASAVAFGNLVQVRLALGQIEEAEAAVEAFARRYPENREIPRFRFWVLLRQGDEAGARAQMQSLLQAGELDPSLRIQAHDQLAWLAAWRGHLGEAREHLAAAERLALDMSLPFWWFRRIWSASLESFVGDPDRVAELLLGELGEGGRAADLEPGSWGFLPPLMLGNAGRADEAEALIREWEAQVPPERRGREDQANIDAARALVLLHRGEADEALRLLEGVRTSTPCSLCWADLMGWALRDGGRRVEAAEEWELVAAMRERNAPVALLNHLWVIRRLAPLYEELGEPRRAAQYYRRVVELWGEADEELQPTVRHARERIEALETGAGL